MKSQIQAYSNRVDRCEKRKQKPSFDRLQKYVPINSEHKYWNFFQDIDVKNISMFLQNFNHHNIVYHPETFVSPPQFSCVSESNNLMILVLKISMSYFTMKLEIINFDCHSGVKKSMQKINRGDQSILYALKKNNNNKYALKHIYFQQSQNLQGKEKISRLVKSALQEICFYKLLSALEIGPLYVQCLGFDCIIFKNSIQFTLQYCQPPKQDEMQGLWSSLKLLHSCRIVHGNINKSHVLYSPHWKKNVLIDFNCSKIITEKCGQNILTFYNGIFKKQSSQIDDYLFIDDYDDSYCLKKIFASQLFSTNLNYRQTELNNTKIKSKDQNIQFTDPIIIFYMLVELQYSIYHQDQERIKNLLESIRQQTNVKAEKVVISEQSLSCQKSISRKRRLSDKDKLFQERVNVKIPNEDIYLQKFQGLEFYWKPHQNIIKGKELKNFRGKFEKYIHHFIHIFLQFPCSSKFARIKNQFLNSLRLQKKPKLANQNKKDPYKKQDYYEIMSAVNNFYKQKKIIPHNFFVKRQDFYQRFKINSKKNSENQISIGKLQGLNLYEDQNERVFSTILNEIMGRVANERIQDFFVTIYKRERNVSYLLSILSLDIFFEQKLRLSYKNALKKPSQDIMTEEQFIKLYYEILKNRNTNNSNIKQLMYLFECKFPQFFDQLFETQKSLKKSELTVIRKLKLVDMIYQEKYDKKNNHEMLFNINQPKIISFSRKFKQISLIIDQQVKLKEQKIAQMPFQLKLAQKQLEIYRWISSKLIKLSQSQTQSCLNKKMNQILIDFMLNHIDSHAKKQAEIFLRYLKIYLQSQKMSIVVDQEIQCQKLLNQLHQFKFSQSCIVFAAVNTRICQIYLRIHKRKKAQKLLLSVKKCIKYYRQQFYYIETMAQLLKIEKKIYHKGIINKQNNECIEKSVIQNFVNFYDQMIQIKGFEGKAELTCLILTLLLKLKDFQIYQKFQNQVKIRLKRKLTNHQTKKCFQNIFGINKYIFIFSNCFSKSLASNMLKRYQNTLLIQNRIFLSKGLLELSFYKVNKINCQEKISIKDIEYMTQGIQNITYYIHAIFENLEDLHKMRGQQIQFWFEQALLGFFRYKCEQFLGFIWLCIRNREYYGQFIFAVKNKSQIGQSEDYKSLKKFVNRFSLDINPESIQSLQKSLLYLIHQAEKLDSFLKPKIFDIFNHRSDTKKLFLLSGELTIEIAFDYLIEKQFYKQIIMLEKKIIEQIKLIRSNYPGQCGNIYLNYYLRIHRIFFRNLYLRNNMRNLFLLCFQFAMQCNSNLQDAGKNLHFQTYGEYSIILYQVIQMIINFCPEKLENLINKTKIFPKIYRYLAYCQSHIFLLRIKLDCYYYFGKVQQIMYPNKKIFTRKLKILQFRQSCYRQQCDYYSYILNKLYCQSKSKTSIKIFIATNSAKQQNKKQSRIYEQDLNYYSVNIIRKCKQKIGEKLSKYYHNKKLNFRFSEQLQIGVGNQSVFQNLINCPKTYLKAQYIISDYPQKN